MRIIRYISFFALFMVLATSCRTSISTFTVKQYAPSDTSEIIVYKPGEPVPNSAEIIGAVKMAEYKRITHKRYSHFISKGKVAAARIGGNGLMVHKYTSNPNLTMIDARILRLTDTIVDETQTNPVMEYDALFNEIHHEYDTKRRVPANTVTLNGGYGSVFSDVYLSPTKQINPVGGFDLLVEYNHTFRNGLGVGAQYSGYFHNKEYASIIGESLFTAPFYMSLNYFGPTVTYALRYKRFIARAGYTLGVGYNSANLYTCFGTGGNIKLELMLCKRVGINFTTGVTTFIYSGEARKYGLGGISRVSFIGGINFYL